MREFKDSAFGNKTHQKFMCQGVMDGQKEKYACMVTVGEKGQFTDFRDENRKS